MVNDALSEIAGSYGSVPVTSAAQTVNALSVAFEAWEATTFGVFKKQNGVEIADHPWKAKQLPEGKLCTFGPEVATFTITAGGLGQYYKSGEEVQIPECVSADVNAAGTLVILTFDRPMASPAAYPAHFQTTLNGVDNGVVAAALGSNVHTIELTLLGPIVAADVVTASTTYGSIASAWGGKLVALSGIAVTNPIV